MAISCRAPHISLAQAQAQHPFLKRARESYLQFTHAGAPVNDLPCWVWFGWLDQQGYGRMEYGEQRAARVHRVTYQLFRHGLTEDLVVDHLCRNRACCNPWHLQAVSSTVNTQRGARAEGVCRNGLHRMTPENTIVRVRGGLPRYECRACKAARAAR